MKHWLAALGVLLFVIPGLLFVIGCSNSGTQKPPLDHPVNAAIVDQLSPMYPNAAFIRDAQSELEACGFTVDIYSGDEITVNFFRNLPSHNYDLIILRAHSGLLGVDPEVTNRVWLFTNEEYDSSRFVPEQLSNRLTYGKVTDSGTWVFTLSAEFVNESMAGKFDNTVIIMMGCSGLYRMDLAEAFVGKGASVYLGWDGSVVLGYVDRATGVLLDKLCSEELTITAAVTETNDQVGFDPQHGARLRYHPVSTYSQTLFDLIE